jgi:hypothetical protein
MPSATTSNVQGMFCGIAATARDARNKERTKKEESQKKLSSK